MSTLFDFVTSRRNIYRAIYALESYIDDPNLLTFEDLELYYRLSDKFNWEVIDKTISACHTKLKDIISKRDELFEVKVYYSLKKIAKEETTDNKDNPDNQNIVKEGEDREEKKVSSKIIYRPLHTASLIDQICMVAMLQILMYEDGDFRTPDTFVTTKLVHKESKLESKKEIERNPTDLTRSIPNNFYGNKWSKTLERIYQNWVPNYQEYNKQVIESEHDFAKSHKYDYEVTLDIKNFFPSISPIYLYKKICNVLKERFLNDASGVVYKKDNDNQTDMDTSDDIAVMKRIVAKLLFLKIKEKENVTNDAFSYYDGVTIDEKATFMAKGVAQGLPQSYFFGNLCMTDIRREVVADGFFKGKDYFYVDDSVIYVSKETMNPSGIDDKDTEALNKSFNNKIKDINKKLLSLTAIDPKDELLQDMRLIVPEHVIEFHKRLIDKEKYSIEFHPKGKSHFAHIDEASVSQIELNGLARENSGNTVVFDLEGDDNEISYEKLTALESYVLKMIEVMDYESNNNSVEDGK